MTTKKKTVLPDRYLRAYQEGMVGPYSEENVRAVNKKSDLLKGPAGRPGGVHTDRRKGLGYS